MADHDVIADHDVMSPHLITVWLVRDIPSALGVYLKLFLSEGMGLVWVYFRHSQKYAKHPIFSHFS
jgi:hypothetical protein